MVFGSIEELVDFAVSREMAAAAFYLDLADRVNSPAASKLLRELAAEEHRHRAILQDLKASRASYIPAAELRRLDVPEAADSREQETIAEALRHAIETEKGSFELYSSMARISNDNAVVEILLKLAMQEDSHQKRLELALAEL